MSRSILLLLVGIQSILVAQEINHVTANTPKDIQIQVLKSAAPRAVSDNADLYILTNHGYELAVKGTNGFSCLIEREMTSTMEPECYDAEGTKTTLQVRLFIEKQRALRVAETQIEQSVKEGYRSGEFRAPSKPGIVYMLSKSNYVFDPQAKAVIHFPGHLMFYAPYATEKTIGSGKGAPYIVHPGEPDAVMVVVPAGETEAATPSPK